MRKIALEALQEIRIKYRWSFIDQENEAIEKRQEKNKKFETYVLTNDDT
jgi:hypothetical protein